MPQTSNSVGTQLVPVEAITSRVSIRSVKKSGVERIKASMRKFGFLPQHALLVTQKADGTFELEDGNHRLDAAIDLDITEVPVHIIGGVLSDNDKKKIARESNEVAGTLILTTLVDDAEFIWGERELGKNLIDIADILGWSGAKVKQYSALSGITKEAWEIIKTTIERNERVLNEESDEKVTIVTFSEGLLRCILNLTPEQQIELVKGLVSGEITKGQFRTQASNYHASNDVKAYVAKNPEVVSTAAFDGLTPYVVNELEGRDASFDDIASIAKWAREYKADINHCASWALLIGSWMLGCKEGDTPKIGDPPYTQEQLENEGWKLWSLVPKEIDAFIEIGKLQRSYHDLEVSKGKDFFDVTDEDMLANCSIETVLWLARSFTNVMFRSCHTIWKHVSLGMSAEEKEKFLNGKDKTRAV